MKKTNWNENWVFFKAEDEENRRVINLPHDAMIEEPRIAELEGGNASGFFPGGKYVYEKTIDGTELETKAVLLEFEGVYMNSSVYLNDEKVGGWVYGYTGFYVDLTGKLSSGNNTIRIVADNSLTPNSRWYSGSGIYRDVNLYVGKHMHIIPDGVRITTLSLSPAIIRVETEISGDGEITAQILKDGQVVAMGKGSDFSVEIPDALLWSAETPELYELSLSLMKEGVLQDTERVLFGIRLLSWCSQKGFSVNGEAIKLKGGCIHHDNGLLGACEYKKAAYRKIRKLKEFGYNAIRYSHYPAAKAVLEACDRLGMYVLDESFDQWKIPQTKYDYALWFEQEWEKDLADLVRKDFNHPSVIMYCIGNEITDIGQSGAAETCGKLARFLHENDNTRPVTIASNCLLSYLAIKIAEIKSAKQIGSADVNEIMTLLPKIIASLTPEIVEAMAGDVFKEVDIVGYNYNENLYERTHELAPDRIILSSETFPARMAKNWELVGRLPYVVGDFMWTAWDYLGEAGVGLAIYGTKESPFAKPYPCMLAACGSFDITGYPETQAYLASIVFGVYHKPYIAVRPVNHSGEDYNLGNWRLTDAVHSWSWVGQEGENAEITVYGAGKSVELFQDGISLGKKTIEYCHADFQCIYRRGRLIAVLYDENGEELGKDELVSAEEEIKLEVCAEDMEIGANDFTYINVCLTDNNGIPHMLCDRKVTVRVEGDGRLRAVGSGNPVTEERFSDEAYTTYFGRMQAIVEAHGKGEIIVTVSAEDLEDVSVVVTVK